MSDLFKGAENFWIKNTRKALAYHNREELSKLGAYWDSQKRCWRIEKIFHKGATYQKIQAMGLKLIKAEK